MGLEKYESKQQQIFKPAARIFPFISRFDMLTPALQDKVEEWSATEDTCSFKVKGFTVAFWIQLHEVSESDTRIRMVLHAELNMMMRMMIGSKIQGGLDKAVEGLAQAFNQLP